MYFGYCPVDMHHAIRRIWPVFIVYSIVMQVSVLGCYDNVCGLPPSIGTPNATMNIPMSPLGYSSGNIHVFTADGGVNSLVSIHVRRFSPPTHVSINSNRPIGSTHTIWTADCACAWTLLKSGTTNLYNEFQAGLVKNELVIHTVGDAATGDMAFRIIVEPCAVDAYGTRRTCTKLIPDASRCFPVSPQVDTYAISNTSVVGANPRGITVVTDMDADFIRNNEFLPEFGVPHLLRLNLRYKHDFQILTSRIEDPRLRENQDRLKLHRYTIAAYGCDCRKIASSTLVSEPFIRMYDWVALEIFASVSDEQFAYVELSWSLTYDNSTTHPAEIFENNLNSSVRFIYYGADGSSLCSGLPPPLTPTPTPTPTPPPTPTPTPTTTPLVSDFPLTGTLSPPPSDPGSPRSGVWLVLSIIVIFIASCIGACSCVVSGEIQKRCYRT